MQYLRLLALFFCCALAMTGCGAGGGGGTDISVSDVGNVEGTVTDASTGTALSGVTVQVGDKSDVTGDNGVYSIQDIDVGSRTITATITGYQSYIGTVTVSKGTTVSHNIEMTTTGTTPDTTPPTVSSTSPASSATGVAVSSGISVTFSEAMDCSTITTSSFTLRDSSNNAVAGTITTCNNTSAVFTPSSNLSYSTSYTTTITSGVKDAAGNAMASSYSWSFTTGAQPTTAPSSPTGVSATAGNSQVTISWGSVSGATSYNLYWSTTTGVTKSSGTKISNVTSPYIQTGLTNGTTHYYVVTAVNSYGESSESSEASAVPTNNTAPTANAGSNQTVFIASLVTLDGSGSSDTDGDTLTYSWTLTSRPSGSSATISGYTTANPTFTPDVGGTYVASLIVNDGTVNSSASTVTITTASFNAVSYIDSSTTIDNGKIYIISDTTAQNFNLTTLQNEVISSMNQSRFYASTEAVNGKIYVIGGDTGWFDETNIVEEYNPVTDTWTYKQSAPTSRARHCSAVVNNKIYVIGGLVGNVVEEYDPSTDTWQTKASIPTDTKHCGCTVYDNKIYVLGGQDGLTPFKKVQMYDPTTNTWTAKTAMPEARTQVTASTLDDTIYVAVIT